MAMNISNVMKKLFSGNTSVETAYVHTLGQNPNKREDPIDAPADAPAR
jgi:hypothetical protein